jgi:hypothetical protein
MKAAPTIATEKIRMMKSSLRCLTFGLLGLLPIIGLPFAFAGLWDSFRARKIEAYFWNPARPHRIAGLVCATLGALIWSMVSTVLIYHAVNNYIGS